MTNYLLLLLRLEITQSRNLFANFDRNNKVYLFSKIIKNILLNFIPHQTILFDDRDPI